MTREQIVKIICISHIIQGGDDFSACCGVIYYPIPNMIQSETIENLCEILKKDHILLCANLAQLISEFIENKYTDKLYSIFPMKIYIPKICIDIERGNTEFHKCINHITTKFFLYSMYPNYVGGCVAVFINSSNPYKCTAHKLLKIHTDPFLTRLYVICKSIDESRSSDGIIIIY
jgi:hypothetical protein